MKSHQYIFLIVILGLLSACKSPDVFTVQRNGAPLPRSKQYYIMLKQDTLFLDARSNMKIEGNFFYVLPKEKKKEIWNQIHHLDFSLTSDQHGDGSEVFVFELITKKINEKNVISGLIPKPYKEIITEIERMIATEEWIASPK